MLFSLISNLKTYYNFKLDFQKVDQHTGGKWLIHGTKRIYGKSISCMVHAELDLIKLKGKQTYVNRNILNHNTRST